MLLFVYGSLRRGQHHHAELRSARYLRAARTEACYELVDLGPYPALLDGGSTVIVGELYEVDDALLARLDAFEEVPGVYQRKRARIADVDATVYVMHAALAHGAPRIASGDWVSR